jgi:hypothetical protein
MGYNSKIDEHICEFKGKIHDFKVYRFLFSPDGLIRSRVSPQLVPKLQLGNGRSDIPV